MEQFDPSPVGPSEAHEGFQRDDENDLLGWLLVSDQLSFDGLAFDGLGVGIVGDDDGEFSKTFDTVGPELGSVTESSKDRGEKRGRPRERLRETSETSSSNAPKRPRDDVRHLEERIKTLQEENIALQAHVLNVTNRTTEIQRHRVAMEKEMSEKMNCQGDADREKELADLCQKYKDMYSDYGQFRQNEVSFHLDQIEKLLVPTLVTKMSLWTLQQDQSFYQSGKSPLWDSISKTLEITSEQLQRIQQGRQRIKALLSQLQESLNLVAQLRTAISKRHAFFDEQCGGVQQIATPQQMVQFLLWMSKNSQRLTSLISSSSGLDFAGTGGEN